MKYLLAIFIFCTPLAAFANQVNEAYFIFDQDRKFVELIQINNWLTADHPNQAGYELYGPSGTNHWLLKNNIPHITMKIPKEVFVDYPSFEEIEQQLQTLASEFPEIMHLETIGSSC